jgi:hypothetical protein
MPRLQKDDGLAALVRMVDETKIPAFLGDEKELDALVASKMETGFGDRAFSNLMLVKCDRKGEYTAIPHFTFDGVRRTLGRHPLAKACYIADLYNIEIIDKFIKPVGTVTNRAMLNLHWDADHLDWLKHEETSMLFVEGLLAWFKSHGGLDRRVGPRVRKSSDESAQVRWARRSQFGSQALAVLARFEDLAAKMEAGQIVERVSRIETMLTALCKAVASDTVLPLDGGEDYTSPRCLLCKSALPEPGSDHCARCQPGLVLPGGGLVMPGGKEAPAL